MTLWSIFRSPLMFGGELRDNDEWTLSLLTNEEVLDMHKNSHSARQVYRQDDKVVWTAKGDEENLYVALFNIGNEKQKVTVNLNQLDLPSSKQVHLRDLWKCEHLGSVSNEISYELSPHSAKLLKISL